jgi:hypothetical protein
MECAANHLAVRNVDPCRFGDESAIWSVLCISAS